MPFYTYFVKLFKIIIYYDTINIYYIINQEVSYVKKLLILLLCFLTLFFCFIYKNSPEKALSLYNKINREDNKILNQTTINQNSKMFIATNHNNVYFYILSKNHLNHWKVNNIFGYPKKNVSDGYAHSTLTCSGNMGYENIYYGTTNYKNTKIINNKQYKLIKLGLNLYAWYYLTNNTSDFNLKIAK